MKKINAGFWKSDWFLGLAVSLVLLILGNGDLLQSLERKAYDMGVQMTSRVPSDKIAVIAIDKISIDNIGRWPWSREIMADMVDQLAAAKAKVVATTIFYSEPQRDPGLVYIDKLMEACGVVRETATVAEGEAPPSPVAASTCPQIAPMLLEAEQVLNTDRRFAGSLERAGNVALPMLFRLGDPLGKPDRELPDYVRSNGVKVTSSGDFAPIPTVDLDVSVIPSLGSVAAAIGHLNVTHDVDGGIRAEPLVLGHFNEAFPALSLLVAAKSLNLGPADIQVSAGEFVRLGRLKIATDPDTRMATFFYKDREGHPAFPVDSFFDVKTGKIPFDKYRDKIVLIGPTAAGVGNAFVTPVSPAMPAVLMQAHAVSSILSEHFFVAPSWGLLVEKLVFLLVAIYLIALLPRLRAGMAAGITAAILVALVAVHFVLITTQLLWLQLMVPATLLLVGHLLLTTKRFLVTERGKEKSDLESAESNRMLGLAFQGQGQLDMAFDKFRKCPPDNQLMENLYNLALDFERKRQFNKAEAVFRYMSDYDPKFRDLEQRLARAKQMSETVILGGGGGRSNASTMILDGGTVEKPMLGRYQIEKELGKGAMGVVYLGRDPKINRVVAIKTMALSQEFEEDELVEVKERFFREAETAGRLNHPNIVTMYDAGEEHDLAYIAMEFLKGKDLVPYTKVANLLPLPQVMSIVARVAEALSYAHGNSVVHRDIKPANVMYEPESDSVKVTDFGIARITDSSKTKTGMVLGTPSYMSPEQLGGKKIDGRSDLFSLGVTLYQLASGKLPFEGDSMAQLMFKIANEPHPDIRTVRPDLPECLVAVIDRALVKDADQRYQTGAEMAADLKSCIAATPIPTAGGGNA
ncbi:CHASE2 domain-containing serine/threonine-protein kinase [Denitratisoma oestradiolicum]|uniref:non-specific serine/threonine protein kinase n=1 Tax=Denitratisoma oestradiolicum TaxID=311182 RepID=A0A6S6XWF1_9PROT|nr:serine/threonine-protein kinase [Denitratisoma oestradiolicum]TWO81377.1 serine/threonine protein kinase [Denitratisoma oestradiolicum]CAB1368573.1 Serine/threonine protein kinase [Denitratisoma oestradiolicum]